MDVPMCPGWEVEALTPTGFGIGGFWLSAVLFW